MPGAGVRDEVGVARADDVAVEVLTAVAVAMADSGSVVAVAVAIKESCDCLVNVGFTVPVGVGRLAPGRPLVAGVATTLLGVEDVVAEEVAGSLDPVSIASIVSTISATETSSPADSSSVLLVGVGKGLEGLIPSDSTAPPEGIGVASGSTTVTAGSDGVSISSAVDKSSPVSLGSGSSFCKVSTTTGFPVN
jgi:hypothetical protein